MFPHDEALDIVRQYNPIPVARLSNNCNIGVTLKGYPQRERIRWTGPHIGALAGYLKRFLMEPGIYWQRLYSRIQFSDIMQRVLAARLVNTEMQMRRSSFCIARIANKAENMALTH